MMTKNKKRERKHTKVRVGSPSKRRKSVRVSPEDIVDNEMAEVFDEVVRVHENAMKNEK